MQAIQTKYFGPGNVRGARLTAKAEAGSITMPYDHELNSDGNHRKAALLLMAKMNWTGDFYGDIVSGQLPDQSYVHVMTGRAPGRIKDALGNLLQWAVGNRGAKEGNPYCKPEVCEALKALYYARTGIESFSNDYMDASDDYRAKVEG